MKRKRYEHNPEIRFSIGFALRIATILFSRFVSGKEPTLRQSDIVKLMDITNQNFYNHITNNKDTIEEDFQKVGLTRFKNGKFYYFSLDTDVYKNFLFNVQK